MLLIQSSQKFGLFWRAVTAVGAIFFVVKVLVGLALFFGFAISFAVANGIISSLAYDTQRAKEGRIMGSWQTVYVIREYKRLNPGGRRHRQAYLAVGVGVTFALALIAFAVTLASS